MSLQSALKKLDEAFDDLSSLHVQTFTGSIKFKAEGRDIKSVESAIEAETNKATSKLTLVAESMYKFDGDSYNFVTSDTGGIPSSALELHKAAVEGGVATRQGLMQLIKGIFD